MKSLLIFAFLGHLGMFTQPQDTVKTKQPDYAALIDSAAARTDRHFSKEIYKLTHAPDSLFFE